MAVGSLQRNSYGSWRLHLPLSRGLAVSCGPAWRGFMSSEPRLSSRLRRQALQKHAGDTSHSGTWIGGEITSHRKVIGAEVNSHGKLIGDEVNSHGKLIGDEVNSHGKLIGGEVNSHGKVDWGRPPLHCRSADASLYRICHDHPVAVAACSLARSTGPQGFLTRDRPGSLLIARQRPVRYGDNIREHSIAYQWILVC